MKRYLTAMVGGHTGGCGGLGNQKRFSSAVRVIDRRRRHSGNRRTTGDAGSCETNNGTGVLEENQLITEDDQSKPEEAARMTKLITRDGVKAVIGEVASSRSLAAAPICQDNMIPMVTPASTNPEVTRKGDYIFRVCYIDPFQGEILAKFAFNSLGFKNVAILKDVKNDYSVGLAQFFEETFIGLGGNVVASQATQRG
jgi:branched-chain amino acid transport system substrate-binding protein